MLNGNRINLTYTDTATNTQHQVSIVRVDDPSALPLERQRDRRSERRGVRRRFFRRARLGRQPAQQRSSAARCSSPIRPARRCRCWTTARANTTDVNALVGDPDRDGARQRHARRVGAVHRRRRALHRRDHRRSARRRIGFAGRIAVNPALLGDPSKLTLYGPSTAIGDPTRPNFIYDQLTSASFAFSATDRPRQRQLAVHRQRCRTICGRC